MDFLIEPLPVNDLVHTVSKISALWGIPDGDELGHATPSAFLGWTGAASDLAHFATGFVAFGAGDAAAWPDAELAPLVEYVASLRAPANPTPPDPSLVTRGGQLFFDKGCDACHGGPRGMGTRLYSYEEIGTDPAMKDWLDPNHDGTPCCNVPPGSIEPLTHSLKSPRLTGLWAATRFLHNGAVSSLESLFCLDGPRGSVTELAFGDAGHDYTCNGLAADEKRALVAYLQTR
jgi:hypothetical protein